MSRSDIDSKLSRINDLVVEFNDIAPPDNHRLVQFRADLAGLLVIAMAATYETCVKEVLCEYARRHHAAFGGFAQRNFDRINSRIRVNDLEKYCRTFDPIIETRFKERLKIKKAALSERVSLNITNSYEQILNWRHDFAHAAQRVTTIEEATLTHRCGKRVLYIFDDAFCRP